MASLPRRKYDLLETIHREIVPCVLAIFFMQKLKQKKTNSPKTFIKLAEQY